METKTIYQKIKEALQHEGQSTKYFTKETLDTIIKDRLSYAKSLTEGGDSKTLFMNSDTIKTDFYNKNSCAYCVLNEILSDLQKVYSICVIAPDCVRSFHLRVKGDSLEHAKYLAIAKVLIENTDIYGEITAEEE